jgi:trimeric autotransporter adhesin
MSTKTTFKRVALVAVAALGLGLLSTAPSSAAITSVTVTPSTVTSAIKAGETATISLTVSAIIGAADDTVTVHGVRTRGTSGSVNFNGTTDSTTTRLLAANYAVLGAGTYTDGSISLDSRTAAANTALRAVVQANFVAPSAAGTYEVTIYTSNKGTIETSSVKPFVWTITVTADSKLPDASTTAFIHRGVWDSLVDSDEVVVGSALTSSTIAGTIKLTQKNATNSATEAMQAFVTGPGFIVGANNDSTTGTLARSTTRVISIAAPTVGQSTYIGVYSDGTAGKATITVIGADSGRTLASKEVTFSSATPSSVTAVVKKAYVAAGQTTPKAIAVTVADSAGNPITGATITGTRTDTTTAGKALASANLTCGSFDTTDSVYYCSTVGASSAVFGKAGYTITATGADALATKVTTTTEVTYSDIVATKVTISAPASASVGDKITYTLTATDKNGYPVADTTYEGAHNASALGQFGGIFWNTTSTKVPDYTSSSVKPFNTGETITTVNGVATVELYMPVAAGTVAATWTLAGSATAPVGAIDKSIAGTTITVSTAVVNPGVDAATDAANEATDAANAATDAALAAADAADAATAAAQDASDAVAALSASVSKLISSLRAQITSLTNLVIKIQKKVRA